MLFGGWANVLIAPHLPNTTSFLLYKDLHAWHCRDWRHGHHMVNILCCAHFSIRGCVNTADASFMQPLKENYALSNVAHTSFMQLFEHVKHQAVLMKNHANIMQDQIKPTSCDSQCALLHMRGQRSEGEGEKTGWEWRAMRQAGRQANTADSPPPPA